MVLLLSVAAVLSAACGALVVVLVQRFGSLPQRDGDAVSAAVEALSRERDAALDALRAELATERQQLAVERERALQATVDTVLTVAGDKLGSHADRASHELGLRNQAIDQRVADMNGELRRVRELVGQLQKEKAEQHGQLVQGIDTAIRASTALNDTTQSLREALSNSRARGQWGERMAEDVLRVAGLAEGVSYKRQQTLPGGGRPDFTFMLPRGRLLHMDVKFPLDNYLRVLESRSEPDQTTHTRAFLRDVRGRIRELTIRDYSDPRVTVGYVLLFIPNESVYGFIHEHDPTILDEALGQHVVLCSPCTLFAVLGVVRQAVENFLLERTTDEILECLGGFSRQWQAFSEKLDRLGNQFATAQRTYDDLAGTRRRQLEKQLDQVERLRTDRGLEELDLVEPFDLRGANSARVPTELDGGDDGDGVRSATDGPADNGMVRDGTVRDAPVREGAATVANGTLGGGPSGAAVAVGGAGVDEGSAAPAHPAAARRVGRLRPIRA
jgi:DNA recombination protein RmuC